jgi:TolA-binding protein
VVTRYPRGNKVPDALLKLGYCQLQLGLRDAARKTLARVVADYPKSNPAALASAKLTELEP